MCRLYQRTNPPSPGKGTGRTSRTGSPCCSCPWRSTTASRRTTRSRRRRYNKRFRQGERRRRTRGFSPRQRRYVPTGGYRFFQSTGAFVSTERNNGSKSGSNHLATRFQPHVRFYQRFRIQPGTIGFIGWPSKIVYRWWRRRRYRLTGRKRSGHHLDHQQ